jgi:hypothetical protein
MRVDMQERAGIKEFMVKIGDEDNISHRKKLINILRSSVIPIILFSFIFIIIRRKY